MRRPEPPAQPRSRGEPRAVSSQLQSRDRRPENRELRVQSQRPTEPGALCGRVAEAALDHPPVEHLERVERPEPEGALRVAQPPTGVTGPLGCRTQAVAAVER